MAINIEVKHRLQAIEARLKALEDRPQSIISKETLEELARMEASFRQDAEPQVVAEPASASSVHTASVDGSVEPAVSAPKKKMCPKCGVKPAYFFHVRSCKG